MNVNDLIQEIKDEEEALNNLAFKLYCKHTLKMALERVHTDKERLAKGESHLNSLTTEFLTERFTEYGYDTMSTKKDEWMKKAAEILNK